ncbi:MAG: hypothetical protein MRY63_13620 [Neomegalonema sp.]|nr:hypothetical protein [Neomegalonema sp.]
MRAKGGQAGRSRAVLRGLLAALALLITGSAHAQQAEPNRGVTAAREYPYPPRMIAGLQLIRKSDHVIWFGPGSATDWTSRHLINFQRGGEIDIRRIGPGGRDNVASPLDLGRLAGQMKPDPGAPNGFAGEYADGHALAGKPLAGWYYPVVMLDPDKREVAAMLTRQESSLRFDRKTDAQPPHRFTARRHLPMAFYYDPIEGFRPAYCYGWPSPVCIWTNAGTQPDYAVLDQGQARDWTLIDLTDWMPQSARMVRLQAVVSGTARGGAYVDSLKSARGARMIGWLNNPGDVEIMTFEIGTNSRETIVYRTDPGVELTLYAVGWVETMP